MNKHRQSPSGYAMVRLHLPPQPPCARVRAIPGSFNVAPALNDFTENGRLDGANRRLSSSMQNLECMTEKITCFG